MDDYKGIDLVKIKKLSIKKEEPETILNFRLQAYQHFLNLKNPKYGPSLKKIDFSDIIYYHSEQAQTETWKEVKKPIKQTFLDIGVIGAEENYLGGLATQYESEVVYRNLKNELKEKNIIFCDINTAIKEHYQLFKKYFAKLVKNDDNKYAALNSACFSGGTFIYIPKDTKLEKPLHSYFLINQAKMGQFERTLIIVEENAELTYIEGCSAKMNLDYSLHAAVVEIFVQKNAKCRYITLQNWSQNVYNLVTKRAICKESAQMEWIDGNIGSFINMKYPAIILEGDNSIGKMVSVALATKKQNQDTGAKMIHLGNNTSSTIISKSISQNGGQTTYRGLVFHDKKAINAKSNIQCDTLIIDHKSKSNTIPFNIIKNGSSEIEHEAKVSNISEEMLFYLMSRGLSKNEANQLIMTGFIEQFVKELPFLYAAEFNQLLKHEMKGAIG